MRRALGRGWGRGVRAKVAGGAVLLLAIPMVVPFLYMVSTSLMDEFEALRSPPALLPAHVQWAIFWRVVLPLSRPALATLAVFAFVDQWKNFLWPLIATRSTEMGVVEVGLAAFHGLYYANWPYQMAAAVTAVVPLLLVFFVAQRYFMRGIQLTGLK